jgi:hypothetical protein
LRLHPKNSNMITSTYEPLVGVTSMTDANNTIVYNEYDALNRPSLMRDKDKNIVKRFQYSDTTMTISFAPVWTYVSVGCSIGNPGQRDSTFTDTNIYSDTYGTMTYRPEPGLDCNCGLSGNPAYREINGVCEVGTWDVVSSVKKKIDFVFVWECTWRYTCFSDGINSTYFQITYSPTLCGLAPCF